MNIWNPGAVSLTDNQIYETCSDLLDSENHYCTPVPSRQTSGILSTMPLTGSSSESSCKLSSSKKCVVISFLFLLMLALFFVAIGCCGYAILEIQRLKIEVDLLRGEVDALHLVQREDTVSLNRSIDNEVQALTRRLLEIENKTEVATNELAQQIIATYNQLRTDVHNGLDFLSDEVRENLTSLANLSASNISNLADPARLDQRQRMSPNPSSSQNLY